MLSLSSWDDFSEFVEMTDEKIKGGKFTPRTLGCYMGLLTDFMKIQGNYRGDSGLVAVADIIEQSFMLCRDDEGPIGDKRQESIENLIASLRELGEEQVELIELQRIAKWLQRLKWRVQGLCPSHGEPLTDYPRYRTRAADCCGHERPYGDPAGLNWAIDPDEFDIEKRKLGWPNKPTFKARYFNLKERMSRWVKRRS